jgi:uncharacterized paraquat-inducible protein A
MDFVAASLAYCFLVAGLFLGLGIYYDRRDHARFEAERRQASFHCARCGHLYAPKGETDRSNCPRCAQENSRLSF